MENTLYCFEFNEDTGEISKEEITEYKVSHPYNLPAFSHIKQYRFKYKGRNITIKDDKLDKFLNWKVYTFNDSLENVKSIIYDTIYNKKVEFEKQYNRYTELLEIVKPYK